MIFIYSALELLHLCCFLLINQNIFVLTIKQIRHEKSNPRQYSLLKNYSLLNNGLLKRLETFMVSTVKYLIYGQHFRQ